MNYRERLSNPGNDQWSISLATHLGTDIPNETSVPNLRLGGLRERSEKRYQSMYTPQRPPVAGYNCFGHVFASRRTALYDIKYIDQILCEDGYGQIVEENGFAVGDIVIYSDEDGPNHVARIIRFDENLISTEATDPVRIPVVLSKFDDVSGEYEHRIDDYRWALFNVTYKVYRERHQAPCRKPDWKARVSEVARP